CEPELDESPWALTARFASSTSPGPLSWLGAGYQKARIRAQKEPVFSPAGTGREEWLPRKVTSSSRTKRADQVTFRKSSDIKKEWTATPVRP
ncbi:hypothetical protein, partial [Pseudomonas viridiflava]|uniref:hypothetical protein n=1 Tax=Pseudomonas viridiflava TaxID=33069 RepID=UPI00197D982D